MDCDVLVIGSGASGLCAAVTAAHHGLKVIVIEKEPVFGGATDWAGGYMWIPGNRWGKQAGQSTDIAAAKTYLRSDLGNFFVEEKVDAFLNAGPHMLSFLELHTRMRFADGSGLPDMHDDKRGAATGGRAVRPEVYDARLMDRDLFQRLRRPKPELTVMGMGIGLGPDMYHFLNAMQSWTSFRYVGWRVMRQLAHLLRYGRSCHLVNGNAMVARLAHSLQEMGGEIITDAPARRLIKENGRIIGAEIDRPDGGRRIFARSATILACGGMVNDKPRRRKYFSHAPTGHEHWSAAPESLTGDGLDLAEAAGGWVNDDLASPAGMTPVSLVPYKNGKVGHFPHSVERAKPGCIAVLKSGRRFVNEADGYHDFTQAMIKNCGGQTVEAWLICDHRFQRRYGLGFARPRPFFIGPYVKSGYLTKGRTLTELAARCGINPKTLVETVKRHNDYARSGIDLEFGKGTTPYNRVQGDADTQPNPCLAPIENGPFYAVRVVPGSFSSFIGVETDANARVVDREMQPIPGLYAVGNDAASVMGGFYPAGGINLGPAMTFGFIAGLTIAKQVGRAELAPDRPMGDGK
jgi:succinate dehydrogenase/fumarate reductase flavoprotein subunit